MSELSRRQAKIAGYAREFFDKYPHSEENDSILRKVGTAEKYFGVRNLEVKSDTISIFLGKYLDYTQI